MFKKGLIAVSKLLLLSLFIFYYVSITFFTHSHVINGVTIVHSHYYQTENSGKSSLPNHNHNESQISLISALSLFQSLQICFGSFILILLVGQKKLFKNNYFLYFFEKLRNNLHLRAPPLFLYNPT